MLMVNQLAGFGVGGGSLPPAEFIGVTPIRTSSSYSMPTGTQAGDIMFVAAGGNDQVTISGGTSIVGSDFAAGGNKCSFAWKLLSASDISTPPYVAWPSFGHFFVAIYRGPTVLTSRSKETYPGSSTTAPGFVKAAGSRSIIGTSSDRDPSNAVGNTIPPGFTRRAVDTSQYFSTAIFDIPSANYDGSSVTFSQTSGGNNGEGHLFELT